MEVFADDRQDNDIPPQTARRLALAVIARAVREATMSDKSRAHDRDMARYWLRTGGDDLQFWLELAGSRITQADLARWVEGLTDDKR